MPPSLPSRPPIIRITNATFYRHHPNSQTSHPNPPLFTDLTFSLPSTASPPQNWCILGPSLSGKTTLLQILRGHHISLPPASRTYPYLALASTPPRLRAPSRAIRYVGFDADGTGNSGLGPTTSAYLSARYESRRESTDFSLRDFLLGNTQLNPYAADDPDAISPQLLARVVADLRLGPLLDLPVAFLSNGQGRRARIARALLTRPEVLLLDEPFMGLDPPTVVGLSALLGGVAAPRLVVSARPQDAVPEWVSHVVYLRTDGQVGVMGERRDVMERLRGYVEGVRRGNVREDEKMPVQALGEMGRVLTKRGVEGEGFGESDSVAIPAKEGGFSKTPNLGEPLVEMSGCQVRYGDKIALGNWTSPQSNNSPRPAPGLHWTVRRGERWGVFGPNGSGKTTIVSLLCSDHPQAYSLPIQLFGRSRLPDPRSPLLPLTFWDIQARIGHSSPEVHQHMPRSLTVRQVITSAWADTFRSRPRMAPGAAEKVGACLRWFEAELNPEGESGSRDGEDWADRYLFGELSFSAQRVLLFIRAVVKNPDIVVLDEAFSGMDESVRDKCALFLNYGEERMLAKGNSSTQSGVGETRGRDGAVVGSEVSKAGEVKVLGLSDDQALICISHVKEEVPDCVREWMCLPEANSGLPARFGRLDGPLRTDRRRWAEIWGTGQAI